MNKAEWTKKFSKQLKKEMSTKQLTISTMSNIIGANERTVCNWVNGRSIPSAFALIKIADTLGVSTDLLVDFHEPINMQ